MGNETTVLSEISSSAESVLNSLMPLCSLVLAFGMFYLFKVILHLQSYGYGFDTCTKSTTEENNIQDKETQEESQEEIKETTECSVIQEESAPEPESSPKIKSRYNPRCPNCWGFLDEDNVCRVCKMVIKQ